MKTVYICKGLPASGKSTWAKKKVSEDPGKYKRVNKDDLRAMLDESHWSKHNEKFVLKVRDFIIEQALQDGKHVIVDDTNLATYHERRIQELAKQNNARAVIIDFTDVPLQECIKRDLNRPNSVGERVIRDMHNKFLQKEEVKVRPRRPGFPQAVIVDLDGTLALMGDRNPYDASTCEQDALCLPVYETVKALSNKFFIICVSGRNDTWKNQTLNWLINNDVPFRALFMRSASDNRKDSIVKKEIFEKHIEPHYDVLLVLDDRDQVVDGWRNLGLTCFQVAPGNF